MSIKPKHLSLREIPLKVYKELPKKSLCWETLLFLSKKHPLHLITILESDNTCLTDKCLIIEALSFSKGQDSVLKALIKYSKNGAPAVREAAVYCMSFFPSDNVLLRLEEMEIVDDNEIIKSFAGFYLQEIYS